MYFFRERATMPKRKERESDAVEAELPLAKYLASTEKRVRDRAIRSLSAFLLRSAKEEGLSMSSVELGKLWKGIFYCYWMSDKPLVQQALAQELSTLVLRVAGYGEESNEEKKESEPDAASAQARALTALDFYHGFWTTTESEWLGVDKFRVNKYYLLMRRFLHAGLELLRRHSWDAALVERFVTVMRGTDGPLASNNVKVPDSITYHVCDIFLDELESVVAEDAADVTIPILPLLSPFLELAATSTSKRVHERVMTAVINPFLEACAAQIKSKKTLDTYSALLARVHADDDDGEFDDLDDKAQSLAAVRRTLLKAAFSIASGSDTYAPSRRKLYALWQAEAA